MLQPLTAAHTRAARRLARLARAAQHATPRAAPAPGKYQFAYDVDITRDLEPPDDNLLIRVRRPDRSSFASTTNTPGHLPHPGQQRRDSSGQQRRDSSRPRRLGTSRYLPRRVCTPPPSLPWNDAHARHRPLATHAAPAPPQPPRRNRLVAVVQVSALKDVGQFVGPESGANVELKRGDE